MSHREREGFPHRLALILSSLLSTPHPHTHTHTLACGLLWLQLDSALAQLQAYCVLLLGLMKAKPKTTGAGLDCISLSPLGLLHSPPCVCLPHTHRGGEREIERAVNRGHEVSTGRLICVGHKKIVLTKYEIIFDLSLIPWHCIK